MMTSEFQSGPDFSTLPDLVLFKIFQFVKGPRELEWYSYRTNCDKYARGYARDYFLINGQYGSLLDLRMVCKRFHEFAKDPRLLTELRIHPQIGIVELVQALEERPLIDEILINFSILSFPELFVSHWSDNTWEANPRLFFNSIKKLKRLKTLTILGHGIGLSVSGGIFLSCTSLGSSFFKAFPPSLTTLHLGYISLNEFKLENFESLANIKTMKVEYCYKHRTELRALLENLTKLEELDVSGEDLVSPSLIPNPAALRLKSLAMDISEVYGECFKVLKECKSLKNLVLRTRKQIALPPLTEVKKYLRWNVNISYEEILIRQLNKVADEMEVD